MKTVQKAFRSLHMTSLNDAMYSLFNMHTKAISFVSYFRIDFIKNIIIEFLQLYKINNKIYRGINYKQAKEYGCAKTCFDTITKG
ncbi:hypothetical protein ACQU6J_002710 [Escherichia coli]|nr:hypothetical protein DEN86_27045 [Escherichia coli]BDI35565.1 hypothetical protein EsCdI10290_01160 [Escherichia sp. 10290]BDI45492.1 hypothetical protein EsCd1HHP049_01123 [Escherichia sp. HH154_1D]